MEFTDGQKCVDGRAQRQSIGTNVVVRYTVVLLPSLGAPNSENTKMPSCNMGQEDNSGPDTVWPPEKIGRSGHHTDVTHPTNTEGERQQITMLDVTAAISVSLIIPSSANFCLTRLSG